MSKTLLKKFRYALIFQGGSGVSGPVFGVRNPQKEQRFLRGGNGEESKFFLGRKLEIRERVGVQIGKSRKWCPDVRAK